MATTIRFTKEDLEMKPLLEYRHRFLRQIEKLTAEDKPIPPEYLCAIELIDKRLEELGYNSSQVDVAAYAETRFQMEDEGIYPRFP